MKRNPASQVFQQLNPLHQPRSVCELEEALQQLRDELYPGSLKELSEGERVTRRVKSAGKPAADQEIGNIQMFLFI